jgi:tetratricopeptide (TPR) repeat protein
VDQVSSFISSATTQFFELYQGQVRFFADIAAIGFIIFLCIDFIIYIGLRLAARRRKTETYWQMSVWQLKENGDWKQQPILWVNGGKYVFGTPQEYIPVLQSIARSSGDPRGNIKSVVKDLHKSARFRANARATRGWKPDPPLKSKPPKPLESSPIPPLEDLLTSMDEYPVQMDSGPPVLTLTPHPQPRSNISQAAVSGQTVQSPRPVMADQPIRASRKSTVPTSAEQDLKAAFSYLEDVERAFFDKTHRLRFDDTPDLFATLDKAAEYVADARQKNPDQTLMLEDDKDGSLAFTIDDIAGAISAREGHIGLLAWRTGLNEDNQISALRRACGAFQKATRFCPDQAAHYVNLANVYRLLNDKPSATESIAAALKLAPGDAEAIKLSGEISQLPEAAQTSEGINPLWYSGLAGVACLVAGMAIPNHLLKGPNQAIPDAVPVLLMLGGWLLIGGSIAIAWMARKSYTEYRDRRRREDLDDMIAESHERRYRSEIERRL